MKKTTKTPKTKAPAKAKKPDSVKAKLIQYLRAARVFRDLKTIYGKLEAKTAGQKAGVRGVLNRNFQNANSLFERNSENRGEYKFRGNKNVTSKVA